MSLTRGRFDRWLSGEEVEGSHGQLNIFERRPPVRKKVLPAKLRAEAYAVSCYRDESRWEFLDRICERLQREGTRFLTNPADPDSIEWNSRLAAIRRDVHKAHAFVRFKKTRGQAERFIAWHRPQHDTLDLFVRLFCRRFAHMNWAILTAGECAYFETGILRFGEGYRGQSLELTDEWEECWREYYRAIYNPARLSVRAMKKEMPMHYWQTLPEARQIPELIRRSRPRLADMAILGQDSADRFLPSMPHDLSKIADALTHCKGCRLSGRCRPTAGSGDPNARLLLVGEQPGDEEEKTGKAFVGPAGQVLRRAMAESGLDRKPLYLTNAVKHFKYEVQGPYRLHKRPERDEVAACRPWLQREIALLDPTLIVCLGSTAALSVTGRLWPVERYRGTWLPSSSPHRVLLTYHPSAILRSEAKRDEYYSALVEDLRLACP